MKTLIILLVLLIGCSTEPEPQYPDGIEQPTQLVESKGCGSVFVYQFIDSTTSIVLTMNTSKVKFTQKRQTVEIQKDNDQIMVRMEKAGNSPDSVYFNYCDDAIPSNTGKLISYKARAGRVTFSTSEDNPIQTPAYRSNYRITIEVLDLHIYDEKDNLVKRIEKIVFWDVRVGWLPG
ncbi:MAG: hypothetical protein L3J41_02395 [Melioribacteraceae bacterium]|nr:hypothetical protein [Melioribacteraceae bacterium]